MICPMCGKCDLQQPAGPEWQKCEACKNFATVAVWMRLWEAQEHVEELRHELRVQGERD